MKKGYRYWASPIQQASGDIIPSRESAALWLWERPPLLDWERPIFWLFECRWHLWGIDPVGCLIIVDTMIARGKTLKDPFAGLVNYTRGCSHAEWTAQELRARWREYLSSQQNMPGCLVPPVEKRGYLRDVTRALAAREAARNPLPTFFALLGSRESDFEYSEAGLKNRLLLENLVGSAKVRLRVISGTLRFKRLLIQSWSPRARTNNRWANSNVLCQ
jgi:hypothetical protein